MQPQGNNALLPFAAWVKSSSRDRRYASHEHCIPAAFGNIRAIVYLFVERFLDRKIPIKQVYCPVNYQATITGKALLAAEV